MTRRIAAPARTALVLLSLLLVLAVTPTEASLVLTSPDQTSGTGLGAVNTVLTVQDDPTESGCVGWDGGSDVIGAAACPTGIPGGDETSITTTRTLSEVGVSSAFNLRIVFNYNEDDNDFIELEDLVLTIYSPGGEVLFTSGAFTPQTFPEPFSGTGTAGFVFRLDTEQALQAEPFFDNPDNRIGLAAELSQTAAGPETFFVADAAAVAPAEVDVSVTKTDSPDPVAVNGNLTYTLAVENQGPNTATGVAVTDTLPATVTFQSATASQGSCTQSGRVVTCDLGDLQPGETVTITIMVVPTQEGTITNSVAVSADESDTTPSNNTDSETTQVGMVATPAVDLALTKTDSPDPVDVGDPLTYTLTVENQDAEVEATGVTLTDTLPSSVDFQSTAASQGTCSQTDRVVTCDLGSLPAGASATVTITVIPQQEGQITNTATVSADQPDSNPANDGATEETQVGAAGPGEPPSADLAVAKTDSSDPVAVGDDLVYTISVDNAGPNQATGVQVTDNLPAAVTFVSAVPTQGTCSESAGVVTCDLGTIAVNGAASVEITVVPQEVGTLVDTAAASADQADEAPGNNSASEETTVVEGDGPTVPIPTLAEWALILFSLLLAAFAVLTLARRA